MFITFNFIIINGDQATTNYFMALESITVWAMFTTIYFIESITLEKLSSVFYTKCVKQKKNEATGLK